MYTRIGARITVNFRCHAARVISIGLSVKLVSSVLCNYCDEIHNDEGLSSGLFNVEICAASASGRVDFDGDIRRTARRVIEIFKENLKNPHRRYNYFNRLNSHGRCIRF